MTAVEMLFILRFPCLFCSRTSQHFKIRHAVTEVFSETERQTLKDDAVLLAPSW